jgi:hypothetical protein
VSALVVPIGPWSNSSISNLSFNHWGLDTTAAVTWLNPKIGFEISVAPGFTFNWENPDTDYTTGTEFHVEFALLHISRRSSPPGSPGSTTSKSQAIAAPAPSLATSRVA